MNQTMPVRAIHHPRVLCRGLTSGRVEVMASRPIECLQRVWLSNGSWSECAKGLAVWNSEHNQPVNVPPCVNAMSQGARAMWRVVDAR